MAEGSDICEWLREMSMNSLTQFTGTEITDPFGSVRLATREVKEQGKPGP